MWIGIIGGLVYLSLVLLADRLWAARRTPSGNKIAREIEQYLEAQARPGRGHDTRM